MNFALSESNKSVLTQLYQKTWPMLIGMLAIMSCQLVDSAFIGQLGAKPLAVVGFSIPVYQLIIGIQVGLGIATTTVISTALGAKKRQYAGLLARLVIAIGLVIISSLCLLLWYSKIYIVDFLGASQSLYPLVVGYWLPWLLSCWLGALLYFGYSLFRAYGETLLPGKVMVLTSIINLVLDPLFIFTFDMGIAGAAWATVVSFIIGCSVIFTSVFLRGFFKTNAITVEAFKGIKVITAFMVPAMLSQFLPPFSAMIATTMIAIYGDAIVAAWGLASRLEFFSIIVVLSLTMAMPPIIGKLRGSKEFDKIHHLVKASVVIVISWQLFLALVLAFSSTPVSTLLTTDIQVANTLVDYLWLVPFTYGAMGVCMLTVSVFSAIGMPSVALGISILRLIGCYLPCLWIGSTYFGLTGLFIGAALGNLLSGAISWQIYVKYFYKLKQSNKSKNSPLGVRNT